MVDSGTKVLFPTWAKLKRDKSNYPVWHMYISDVLQAMGCEDTITSHYQDQTFEADDSTSSEDDSANFDDDFSRMGLGGIKHSPQSSSTPTQESE